MMSVQYLKGVGPERVKHFHHLGISTSRDLLYHFPRKYLDRTKIKKITEILNFYRSQKSTERLSSAEEETIQGKIVTISLIRTRRRKSIVKAAVSDQSGMIYATWFNQPYLKTYLTKGKKVILSGRIKLLEKPEMIAPEYEVLADDNSPPLHAGGLIPCYPLTEGLKQKFMRRTIKILLDKNIDLPEIIDDLLRKKRQLPPVEQAIRQIHFPDNNTKLATARKRFIYEELFLLQLALGLRRNRVRKSMVKYPLKISTALEERIRQRIPFTLTRSQEKVIREIKQDLLRTHPMNRLLQGDVGSGKTVVAIYASLVAIGNKTQVAFMTPTEILAEQHYQTITQLLADSRVKITLLTSGLPAAERRKRLNLIKQGRINLVIGTHSLIQKQVAFQKLSLLIIDEQHKFGVIQRSVLKQKGGNPHTLVMTATPIPRTMAMTLFGDLDISTIDELPPGRQPIKTLLRPTKKMARALDFIRGKLKEGRQVYFVYPLIEQSDQAINQQGSLKSATQMAKYLQEKIFPEFRVTLLHGGMSEKKKDQVMQDFRSGRINILVSTVIIEVGIDVPNASIMVIDHAERYGLAQLHQLRGRIGRGTHRSYCLLFGDFTTPESKQRLNIMAETNDGFRIAEEDLRIRGPGEFLGLKQSGFPEFKIVDLHRDFDILKQTRNDAGQVLSRDPLLKQGQHRCLKEIIIKQFKNKYNAI